MNGGERPNGTYATPCPAPQPTAQRCPLAHAALAQAARAREALAAARALAPDQTALIERRAELEAERGALVDLAAGARDESVAIAELINATAFWTNDAPATPTGVQTGLSILVGLAGMLVGVVAAIKALRIASALPPARPRQTPVDDASDFGAPWSPEPPMPGVDRSPTGADWSATFPPPVATIPTTSTTSPATTPTSLDMMQQGRALSREIRDTELPELCKLKENGQSERLLADHFGTSRHRVRAALRRAVAQGLLVDDQSEFGNPLATTGGPVAATATALVGP